MTTDWEKRYQAGDMPWEKGAPSPGLLEYLAANPPPQGRILVPGCGFGHDVRALSHAGSEVVGIDIAPSAIRGATARPAVAGEKYMLADLFDLPPEMRGSFDWVCEHTCFCAIDPARRADYARAVAGALKPAGALLAIFYLDPGNEDDGPPYGVTLPELDTLFGGAFTLEREWMLVEKALTRGREDREWMCASWENAACLKFEIQPAFIRPPLETWFESTVVGYIMNAGIAAGFISVLFFMGAVANAFAGDDA